MQRAWNANRRDGTNNNSSMVQLDRGDSRLPLSTTRNLNTVTHSQNSHGSQIHNQAQPRPQDSTRVTTRSSHSDAPVSTANMRNDEANLTNTFLHGVLTSAGPTSAPTAGSALQNPGSLTHQLLAQKNSAGTAGSTGPQSRRSSSHSLQNISEPNSEADSDDFDGDEDGDTAFDNERPGRHGRVPGSGFREKRRAAHTYAEQKRRDAIKEGYVKLEKELPSVVDGLSNQKASKAVVLQKSIEYVNYLEVKKKQQSEELEKLKNEYLGLQIMKAEYEKMAVNMRGQTDQGSQAVPDEVKFQVFQRIMDNLFQAYDGRVVTSSFAELSGTAFSWLEECCTPTHIKHITAAVLTDLKKSYAPPRK